ncbi:cyclophane-forming radical SAM/SPASM peptide maturase GrrM/OscB [Rhodopila sp.]|jgi:uncharacterized protein|uniref:cyclophane-forming radical SAM/SPASM peptide maturase GrrM/OscB n=1 Tax=Rhodopila sp. TaxID=2480087 RepID=UPI002CDAE7B8|nr:cyclophane-forming radical SAM/SPASM peptide maturase GrrM/OscB [Rhodopila sp.]HVZ09552.1 cyclophane-forming radical SAM/SPASM peptide maturase GrrM/OscB [Rhodopila sp.]
MIPTPRIDTLVLQPTPFCNIACTYCYLPNRSDRAVMAPDTIRAAFRRVFESGWCEPELTVIWHAGEPLVLPVDYYRVAFALIEELRPPPIRLRHAVQTNGMLVTPGWCALFREHDVGVGVSIDGPRPLHDRYRKTRNGAGTFDRTMQGIRLLREHGVDFHVITVLTADSLDDPESLLDFYTEAGIDQICFNVEESEGDHTSGLFAQAGLRQRFADFLGRFWRGARARGDIRFIREIDSMLPRIVRPDEAPIRNEQVVPFGMVNVAANGDVSSFSPELLGLRHADYADFIVGNVHTHSLAQMLESDVMRQLWRDIAAGVARCQKGCEYFSVCGGGAPVNKLSENGRLDSDRTRFCELTQMVPTDLILDALERFGPTLDQPIPQHAAPPSP